MRTHLSEIHTVYLTNITGSGAGPPERPSDGGKEVATGTSEEVSTLRAYASDTNGFFTVLHPYVH